MVDARQEGRRGTSVLRAKSEEVADGAEHQWHEVQSDCDEHVKRMRANERQEGRAGR